MVSLIDEFPHVRFDLFFPPYSILEYKYYERQNPLLFDRLLAFRTLMIRALIDRPNVRIFAFDDVPSITHVLDNYKDIAHYRREVNEYMVDSMKTGRHQVKPDDQMGSIARLKEQTRRLDVEHLLVRHEGQAVLKTRE